MPPPPPGAPPFLGIFLVFPSYTSASSATSAGAFCRASRRAWTKSPFSRSPAVGTLRCASSALISLIVIASIEARSAAVEESLTGGGGGDGAGDVGGGGGAGAAGGARRASSSSLASSSFSNAMPFHGTPRSSSSALSSLTRISAAAGGESAIVMRTTARPCAHMPPCEAKAWHAVATRGRPKATSRSMARTARDLNAMNDLGLATTHRSQKTHVFVGTSATRSLPSGDPNTHARHEAFGRLPPGAAAGLAGAGGVLLRSLHGKLNRRKLAWQSLHARFVQGRWFRLASQRRTAQGPRLRGAGPALPRGV